MRKNLCHWMLLLAVMLFLAACGSDGDAEAGFADEAESSESAQDSAEASGFGDTTESEDAFGEADEVAEDGLAPESSTDDSEDASGGDAIDDRLTELSREGFGTGQDAEATDGGFFAPEEAGSSTEVQVEDFGIRPFVDTGRDPTSTFALDVDTGSYSLARRLLREGSSPDPAGVRVEEFVNSFDYDYEAPDRGLALHADAGPSPFNPENTILRVGVQAERVADDRRPDASLTFVVDTSGSMDRSDRLGLVKRSLNGLVGELDGGDRVAIVTYSDGAEVLLPPTPVSREREIRAAIDSLRPNGSTNLEEGLYAGYDLARESLGRAGINRVILASDGIANVGLTDPDGLSRMIRDDADDGIQLVAVGVGLGGFNDALMEQLADQGDGFYAYVDDIDEAARLFRDDLVGTLLTVALDGKIQVEFNPETVARYRLIGFENRAVRDDDFRNDAVDAGELGAGHQVTALYELTLIDGGFGGFGDEETLGTIRLRWEDPRDRSVEETSLPVDSDVVAERWRSTSEDFRLAVTVGAWAELLRGSPYSGDVTIDQVFTEAEALGGDDSVDELIELIDISR